LTNGFRGTILRNGSFVEGPKRVGEPGKETEMSAAAVAAASASRLRETAGS
jgi:hypothetical protein